MSAPIRYSVRARLVARAELDDNVDASKIRRFPDMAKLFTHGYPLDDHRARLELAARSNTSSPVDGTLTSIPLLTERLLPGDFTQLRRVPPRRVVRVLILRKARNGDPKIFGIIFIYFSSLRTYSLVGRRVQDKIEKHAEKRLPYFRP